MALSDIPLRMKINMTLMRDTRVSFFDIGVLVEEGVVTLTGDVDTEDEKLAVEEIVHSIEGVQGLHDEMTVGIGKNQEDTQMISDRLVTKLDEEWENLPDQNAHTHSDYMRWALWMILKFRIPDSIANEERHRLELETKERALQQLSATLNIPAMLLAWIMTQQTEGSLSAPQEDPIMLDHAPLVVSPAYEVA